MFSVDNCLKKCIEFLKKSLVVTIICPLCCLDSLTPLLQIQFIATFLPKSVHVE